MMCYMSPRVSPPPPLIPSPFYYGLKAVMLTHRLLLAPVSVLPGFYHATSNRGPTVGLSYTSGQGNSHTRDLSKVMLETNPNSFDGCVTISMQSIIQNGVLL